MQLDSILHVQPDIAIDELEMENVPWDESLLIYSFIAHRMEHFIKFIGEIRSNCNLTAQS